MRGYILVVLFEITSSVGIAQKYVTEKGLVNFFSHATIEDITADNKKAVGLFNASSSELVFSIPIMEFQFSKSLMQEHFNEKYLESDKYPKSTFQGKIIDYTATKVGIQKVKALGRLTIHGVTNMVELPGSIEKRDDKLIIKSKFVVKLKDYNIDIPQLLFQNIAEQVEVTGEFVFKPQ